MTAFYSATAHEFLTTASARISDALSANMMRKFRTNHPEQIASWEHSINLLKDALRSLPPTDPKPSDWGILFEYPLLRLQKRIDIVILAGQMVAVIEFKHGARTFDASFRRQAEDYALDLRDFHAGSTAKAILPILWCSGAPHPIAGTITPGNDVKSLVLANDHSLAQVLEEARTFTSSDQQESVVEWANAAYRPVPTIIEAAELLYAGHAVREIAHASAGVQNISDTAECLYELALDAKQQKQRRVAFVTGVPGSGKTLAGLNVSHSKAFKQLGASGAFLSGNRPLVHVLREALATDLASREEEKIGEARRVVQTEIQLLMDFLKHYITSHPDHPPHENIIVFDEAQRAWDAEMGRKQFQRDASEPRLFLDIMSRRTDWAMIIALVGDGQEINSGEGGLSEWGKALVEFNESVPEDNRWRIFCSPDALEGGPATAEGRLFPGDSPAAVPTSSDQRLHLSTSVRSVRCQALSEWIGEVILGHELNAANIAAQIDDFPVYLTRSLETMRGWLKASCRGSRRAGMLASSGARRLIAYGLPETLPSNDLATIGHWYLKPAGDIRSSFQLETLASEYTSQGLELDHAGLCWGGDFLWNAATLKWNCLRLSGNTWRSVHNAIDQRHIANTYRVLLSRSRIATIIWVPPGDPNDHTRLPNPLNQTAAFLGRCGAQLI